MNILGRTRRRRHRCQLVRPHRHCHHERPRGDWKAAGIQGLRGERSGHRWRSVRPLQLRLGHRRGLPDGPVRSRRDGACAQHVGGGGGGGGGGLQTAAAGFSQGTGVFDVGKEAKNLSSGCVVVGTNKTDGARPFASRHRADPLRGGCLTPRWADKADPAQNNQSRTANIVWETCGKRRLSLRGRGRGVGWGRERGAIHTVDSGRVEAVPGSLVWAGWRQHSGRYPRHRNWVKEEEAARLCVRGWAGYDDFE